jgi:hypothetical protein
MRIIKMGGFLYKTKCEGEHQIKKWIQNSEEEEEIL